MEAPLAVDQNNEMEKKNLEILQTIKKIFQELRECINEREKKLIEELEQIMNTKKKTEILNRMINSINKIKEDINNNQKDFDNIYLEKYLNSISTINQDINNNKKEIENFKEYRFSYEKDDLNNIENKLKNFGKLEIISDIYKPEEIIVKNISINDILIEWCLKEKIDKNLIQFEVYINKKDEKKNYNNPSYKGNNYNTKIDNLLPNTIYDISLRSIYKAIKSNFCIKEIKTLNSFKWKNGPNYKLSQNNLIATKESGGNTWNCSILGDFILPKNKISKWKIKLKKFSLQSGNGWYILIGVGPSNLNQNYNGNYYNCWTFICGGCGLSLKSGSSTDYCGNKKLKEGDIIEVIMNNINGELSFSVNDSNCGVACRIPLDIDLSPVVLINDQGDSIELLNLIYQ